MIRRIVRGATCIGLALGMLGAGAAAAQASLSDVTGEWALSGQDNFRVLVADDGIGTHTAGASGCFDDSQSPYWRDLVETSPGVFNGERLFGNVCSQTWTATTLQVSADDQTMTEYIAGGPVVIWNRTSSRLVGAWHLIAPDDDFFVDVAPNGSAAHTTGDAECWDATPGPFWRNAVRTGPSTWHADRRLGNICNDYWVTEEMTLSPFGDRITENISTGAVRYLERDAPSLTDGTWHLQGLPDFTVQFDEATGTGRHTAGATECWDDTPDDTPGPMWRNITWIGPNTFQADRLLGNFCDVIWVGDRISLAADGQSFTESMTTGAVRTFEHN
jgi:hypothetical protein